MDNKSSVLITIDVERLYKDAEKGAYDFLSLLQEKAIPATFFLTGDVVRNCPDIVQAVLREGHEIACHGLDHPGWFDGYRAPFLTQMTYREAEAQLSRARDFFQSRHIDVKGFRAPALRTNREILRITSRYFTYDSSVINMFLPGEKYTNYSRTPFFVNGMLVLPISGSGIFPIPTGSPYMMPLGIKGTRFLLNFLTTREPIVFYFHSFDLVPLKGAKIPATPLQKSWYYGRTGPGQKKYFKHLFRYLKDTGVRFLKGYETRKIYGESGNNPGFSTR